MFQQHIETAHQEKCNIDFAKEVFEYIAKCESAYIFVGDFSKFLIILIIDI